MGRPVRIPSLASSRLPSPPQISGGGIRRRRHGGTAERKAQRRKAFFEFCPEPLGGFRATHSAVLAGVPRPAGLGRSQRLTTALPICSCCCCRPSRHRQHPATKHSETGQACPDALADCPDPAWSNRSNPTVLCWATRHARWQGRGKWRSEAPPLRISTS